jgi:hypothetical protein
MHHIMNYLKPEWREGKKNCLTFIIGANIHLMLFLFIQYLAKHTGNMFIELLYRFYFVFVIIDVIAMAILYKCYWGRSIVNEMGAEDNWEYDEDRHRYSRKPKQDNNNDNNKNNNNKNNSYNNNKNNNINPDIIKAYPIINNYTNIEKEPQTDIINDDLSNVPENNKNIEEPANNNDNIKEPVDNANKISNELEKDKSADLLCSNCHKSIDKSLICDNDCGTFYCDNCHTSWYYQAEILTQGHNPICS